MIATPILLQGLLHPLPLKILFPLPIQPGIRPMSHLQFYRAMLSRNIIARKNASVTYGVSRNFSKVTQLLFRLQHRLILCNFVAKIR